MEKDKHLLELMDHVEGISKELPEKKLVEEINELRKTIETLKSLPLDSPDDQLDKRFRVFLEEKRHQINNPASIQRWWPYILVAASLAILLYLVYPDNLSSQYDNLTSSSDKIGFIYDLNEQKLSDEEYLWLASLLETEEHPNIRVTLIDLFEHQETLLPLSFTKRLLEENIPAVQMALLNTIDQKYAPEMKGDLLVFNQRQDLDQLVRQRLTEILTEN